jgi:predicted P-loop ATPase
VAVKDEWFCDDLPMSANGKQVIEQTVGKWIVEVAELSGMRKTEIEHLKALLSRQTDRARPAYGRLPTEKRREFILIGTTNDDKYYKDLTGNRRFWPVKAPKFDLPALRRDRDQLWAEAALREAAGESTRLDPTLSRRPPRSRVRER